MTLLSIIQSVTDETGLGQRPTSVIGNADPYILKCLSLLKKVGKELVSRHDWQTLQKEQTFVTTGAGVYTRASIFTDGDFERYVNDTDWDRSNERQMALVTPGEWQLLKSSIVTPNGIVRYYRERGNSVYILPDASGDTIVFEYITKNWIESSTGTRKLDFTADTDVPVFPQYLMELGLKFRLKSAEGLASGLEMKEYEDEVFKNIGYETPKRVLGRNTKMPLYNLPETGVGQ